MRISDWSSDVCSSDLHRDLYGRLTAETQATITAHYQHRHGQVLSEDWPGYADLFVKYRYAYELEGAHETDISGVAQLVSSLYETFAALQLGRASSRERGCQYGEKSVVAGSLKKQK